MKNKRRQFLKTTALTAAAAPILGCASAQSTAKSVTPSDRYSKLDAALAQPVLKKELFADPVMIESVELLKYKKNYICRVRSTDGAEGLSVSNNAQIQHFYPVLVNRVAPYFVGKDARNLDDLLEGVYVFKSNYKVQNLALWVPVATVEFAILDMLGRIANRPIGQLIGEIHHPQIAVYRANNHRGDSAEKSLEKIIKNVEESQAKAVKFKIGGRMSKNKDYPAGRSEKLIPMVRKAFGDEMTIYADSNGSYDVQEAIRIGKILQEYQLDFYEEPTPFDWYEETKMVKDALQIPIAGGEQEPSMRNFRWLIGNNALDIVQPDIFYFGGMIRTMKVARMAATVGKTCVPHISGSGLGYLYMMHFVSAVPNAGPYHEFKGYNKKLPHQSNTTDFKVKDGKITVPTGAGSGVEIAANYVAKHKVVS
ncbi:MAG: mandelate racemase/muconate lactonizing enzyme family protein [Bacteroidota bacterium]